MAQYTCFPVLSTADVERAALLIQQAFNSTGFISPEEQQRLHGELFEVQKAPAAWGLVAPFLLNYQDPNVRFFGAHTAQVKIARDWDGFPEDQRVVLRDALLDLTIRSALGGTSKPIIRKLFIALTSLAMRLSADVPQLWPEWIVSTVSALSERSVHSDLILDFLTIAAEEISSADLLSVKKIRMHQSLRDAVPVMIQVVTSTALRPGVSENDMHSAMKCLSVWVVWGLPADDLTPLIPFLISLLSSPLAFVSVSEVMDEILTKSSLANGSGTKTLTEPLLLWIEHHGHEILQETLTSGLVDEVSRALCKMLVSLGDHSCNYFASHLSDSRVQVFLRLMLGYTSLPGWFGVDEEESDLTLSFWYLLQEALWNLDDASKRFGNGPSTMEIATALYSEVVSVLRKKLIWPRQAQLIPWTKDQRERFSVYRRDVADTLLNCYYVLRDSMLESLVTQILADMSQINRVGWEDVEAGLHCVASVQEGVPISPNPHLTQLFGPDILGRLPTTGHDRVRRTALNCLGSYANWYPTQDTSVLLGCISYIVTALHESQLSLHAANALKELCDANRAALAPHVNAFGELYSKLDSIPDTEKPKILQSIASVIQALPPEDEIIPVDGIVSPIISKLVATLDSPSLPPDEACQICITELQALAGCAKGLTRQADSIFEVDQALSQEIARISRARADPRMLKLREDIQIAVGRTVDQWSTDASTSDAISDLFKAITALPSEQTLISLSPMPLLELICIAARRQSTGLWLSLASMLLVQLDPPSFTSLKSVPTREARNFVVNLVPALMEATLPALLAGGGLADNPDIVQALFKFLENVAQHFVSSFYEIPTPVLNAIMQCAITSLCLQERYSAVASCTFLQTLVQRTLKDDSLGDQADSLFTIHGKAIVGALISGIGGVSPRSTIPNLTELLSQLISARSELCRQWMTEALFSDEFATSRASVQAREKFLKSLIGSRSLKRTKDAATQFAIVARGLENSSFGYAAVTM